MAGIERLTRSGPTLLTVQKEVVYYSVDLAVLVAKLKRYQEAGDLEPKEAASTQSSTSVEWKF